MYVNETNFVATASSIMGEFQRMHVVPEIDAYRLSAIATEVITLDNADSKGMVEYGYAPKESDILRKIKTGIKKIRDKGYNGDLVIHATSDVTLELEMALAGKITSVTFSQAGIDTTVPAVDRVPVIETPQNRMYTAITVYDGKSEGQKDGGYVKGTSALEVNFMIIPRIAPIAISKQDLMRIFTPENYQNANAWSTDYRRFHDLWMKDNSIPLVYVNIKDAKAGA